MSICILVIEDEPTIVEFLKTGLSYEGYKVIVALNGKSGLELFKKEKIDFIILDIMLPDVDGFEVCRKIRASDTTVPILMLTAKKDVTDKVKGLDLGADDYLTKPFSFEELLARIRALLRRTGRQVDESELKAANIVLRLDTREVFVDNEPVTLTPIEFSLLKLLMQHPRRVFTREALLNQVWGYDYPADTNVVDVHISHLREKIKDKPPRLIRTYYGIGYAFYPEGK